MGMVWYSTRLLTRRAAGDSGPLWSPSLTQATSTQPTSPTAPNVALWLPIRDITYITSACQYARELGEEPVARESSEDAAPSYWRCQGQGRHTHVRWSSTVLSRLCA